ncbi:MAG: ABC transporter permease [Bacteroidia bacterium]|nr:ABC transporter permease [Bacteroidia bacterium]
MNFRENVNQGLESIRANSLRAVITCLIIAIGIAALVGILTSIDGMKAAVGQTFSKMGSQSFMIRNGNSVRRSGGPDANIDFKTVKQLEAEGFKAAYKFPSKITLHQGISGNAKLRFGEKETNPNVMVSGVDENYLEIMGFDIHTGRNFTNNDIALSLPLAIIGKEVSTRLFGTAAPENKEVSINGQRYLVIGVLAEKGSSLGSSGGDRNVFIPLNRGALDFSSVEQDYDIDVLVEKVEDLPKAMDEAYFTMRRVRGLKVSDPDNFIISKSDAIAKEALESMGMVSSVGTIIAIITLLGAAISLMNIMLVSVTERTKEIGLRKALGASSQNIRNQFLIEAIVICQLGGLGGIILGMLLGNMVAIGLGSGFIIPWLWMFVSALVCMGVGLAAGLYPANKAASMDPIEALRYE